MYVYSAQKEASYLNFMFPGKKYLKDTEKLETYIQQNPVKCDESIKNECEEIKALLLQKINDGLTMEEYKDLKSYIVLLDNYDIKMSINIILNLFRKENNEIIDIVKKEIELKEYNILLSRKESINSEGKTIYETVTKEPTIGLIFGILKEIIRSYNSFLYDFSEEVLHMNNNSDYQLLLEVSNDILENENSKYLEIVKLSFENRFKHLKQSSIFTDIYNTFKEELRSETIRMLRFRYNQKKINNDKPKRKSIFL